MFVKKVPHDGEKHAEQVINQSMGVRRPPKRAIKDRPAVIEAKATRKEKALPAQERIQIRPMGTKIEDKKAQASAQNQNKDKDKIAPTQANDKLESIKITAPGTYELNLPSLFERDELIMAVKEGTYFIDLSSAFRKGKKE